MCWSRGCFFFSSRRRHTRFDCDWSSDVCSSDLLATIRQGTWFRALEEELVPVQIEGRGDLAFARGTLSLLLDQKGAVNREGTFLTILRKQPGGFWRMAVYSFPF